MVVFWRGSSLGIGFCTLFLPYILLKYNVFGLGCILHETYQGRRDKTLIVHTFCDDIPPQVQ